MDRDFLSAALLFFIGAVALSQTSDDSPRDWVLPLLAIYSLLAIAVALFLCFLVTSFVKNAPDLIQLSRADTPIYTDVAVFCVIVFCWVLLMYGLGFWLASFFMLSAASVYLTQEKTRRNLTINVVVSLGACVVAYFVFLHVFYVPLPKATWWAGLR
ncbi:MAG: tripartite tricarboxylate transporter TctB family protein [Gammaproteobacteria bacterium]|nr:tripartite tricarboxylate transporter TctB family protein [Gammaproteobacteria bacterium]